mmetsp:Transcript_115055/g.365538  ORF Transcript_115055/g.365538 Transcript_115055/m.365538 type:complete len:200 (+) Transcript_115055:234-833(+)
MFRAAMHNGAMQNSMMPSMAFGLQSFDRSKSIFTGKPSSASCSPCNIHSSSNALPQNWHNFQSLNELDWSQKWTKNLLNILLFSFAQKNSTASTGGKRSGCSNWSRKESKRSCFISKAISNSLTIMGALWLSVPKMASMTTSRSTRYFAGSILVNNNAPGLLVISNNLAQCMFSRGDLSLYISERASPDLMRKLLLQPP